MQTVLPLTDPVGEKLGKGGTEYVPVPDTHALIHKCSIIQSWRQDTSMRLSVTQLYLACQIHARISVYDCVCATAGPGRHCGSQLRWLGSEHHNGSGTKRFDRGTQELEAFLWSRAVTVGHPALSSQTGFYWTRAASAATKQRGGRDRERPSSVLIWGLSETDELCYVSTLRVCVCLFRYTTWCGTRQRYLQTLEKTENT